ncbi:MAG: hypothetical protein HW384_2010 [Dehalococcoidia bacterium]|nr:hypothetical protein [Dehalococcoidia bacterium]
MVGQGRELNHLTLGGLFIPSGQAEIRQVARQIVSRIVQELTNIEGTTRNTPVHRHIAQLIQVAQ